MTTLPNLLARAYLRLRASTSQPRATSAQVEPGRTAPNPLDPPPSPSANGVGPRGGAQGDLAASGLPPLLLPDEVAVLLRTSRRAVYRLAEREQLPGVVRLGRRLLFRRDDLLNWLQLKSEDGR